MKLTKTDPDAKLLEQPNRRRIVEHLERVPGDHFRSIVRALHLSRGTVRYHLLLLKREDLVRSETIGGKCRYFLIAGSRAPLMNDAYKKYWKHTDLRTRVWSAVLRLSDPRPSTVAAALGLSRQLAAYHLKQLAEEGRVIPTGGSYLPVDSRRGDDDLSETPIEAPTHLGDAFRVGVASRWLSVSVAARVPSGPARYPGSGRIGSGLASNLIPGAHTIPSASFLR